MPRCAAAPICRDKAAFLFDMFDFNSAGALSYDELALLICTAILAVIATGAAIDAPG